MSVQELRMKSGAGIVACSKALKDANGNVDKAILLLRERGEAKADGYGARTASNGCIGVYLHHDKTKGVMVQLNCETDFVARTPEFVKLANDIAMHVMATNPKYVSMDQVPANIVEQETALITKEFEAKKMSGDKLAMVVKNKLEKVLKQDCLLEQLMVTDSSVTVSGAIKQLSAKCGEKIELVKVVALSV